MMNKYQSALEYFLLSVHLSETTAFDFSKYFKHRKALKELVDKEIPVKPIIKGSPNRWHCPKCDCSLMFDNQKYCNHCGQKLDWSDTDE